MQDSITQPLRSGIARVRGQLQLWPWRLIMRRLSMVTTVGMFLVLVMGTLVTNSGSAQGCGNSWPLCHGQFIPQFAVSTAIEFSHRAVTGIESLLVFALTAGVLWLWRERREIRILAPLMLIFLLAQAALGALAVKYPQTPSVLALHFGISLISFASILLTALFIHGISGWDRLRDRAIPTGFRRLVFGVAVYSYVVVYLGAYVRHTNSQLACVDWPLCNGRIFPGFIGGVGIMFTHRVAALLLTVGTLWLYLWSRHLRRARPDLYWGALAALILVVLQALEGAIIVYSKMEVFSTLAHGGLVALLFGALSALCLYVLPRPRTVRQTERASRAGTLPARATLSRRATTATKR
ncbi:MAG: heme A synthase [Ktedonobacterales bacterium]|nr:heme A synthase [Ktedonobacterales bacterium]